MTVDPAALARMSLYSVLFGAGLALFLECLRIICGLIDPTTPLSDTSGASVGIKILLAVRDIVFFTVGGIAFSVFVYATNNGKVRFIAVAGMIIGFFAFYFTVGKLLRRVTAVIVVYIYKCIFLLLRPFRIVFGAIADGVRGSVHIMTSKHEEHMLKKELERAMRAYEIKSTKHKEV